MWSTQRANANIKQSLAQYTRVPSDQNTTSFQIRMHMVYTVANKTAPLRPRRTPFSPVFLLPWKPADLVFAGLMPHHIPREKQTLSCIWCDETMTMSMTRRIYIYTFCSPRQLTRRMPNAVAVPFEAAAKKIRRCVRPGALRLESSATKRSSQSIWSITRQQAPAPSIECV